MLTSWKNSGKHNFAVYVMCADYISANFYYLSHVDERSSALDLGSPPNRLGGGVSWPQPLEYPRTSLSRVFGEKLCSDYVVKGARSFAHISSSHLMGYCGNG